MLKIKDSLYQIQKANLSAIIPEENSLDIYNPNETKGIYWMLHFSAENSDFDYRSDINLEHENIKFSCKSWLDLEGECIEWNEFNENSGWLSYNFLTPGMPQGKIIFGKRTGLQYAIQWHGISDLLVSDYYQYEGEPAYEKNAIIQLDAMVNFRGITVYATEHDNEDTILKYISKYVIPEEYEISPLILSGPIKDNGVKLAEVKLTPRDEST